MSAARRRYGPQMRLPEVGAAGQERMACASIAPRARSDGARTVELRYLEGAGCAIGAGEGPPDPRVDALLAQLELEHPEARAVAEGALAALVALRDVLGLR